MRIKEELKKSGYFWLPENENKKIPGTLSILDVTPAVNSVQLNLGDFSYAA